MTPDENGAVYLVNETKCDKVLLRQQSYHDQSGLGCTRYLQKVIY